jgi:hypothetical protein
VVIEYIQGMQNNENKISGAISVLGWLLP